MNTKAPADISPNQVLADLVLAKLKEKGFIANKDAAEISTKLQAGTASREDWKLWIELAQEKQQKESYDGAH